MKALSNLMDCPASLTTGLTSIALTSFPYPDDLGGKILSLGTALPLKRKGESALPSISRGGPSPLDSSGINVVVVLSAPRSFSTKQVPHGRRKQNSRRTRPFFDLLRGCFSGHTRRVARFRISIITIERHFSRPDAKAREGARQFEECLGDGCSK